MRIFSESSFENFSKDLNHFDLSQVLQSNSVNESYNIFYQIFKEPYKKYFPMKQIRVNSKNEISPNITPALKNKIRERNTLERLVIK